MHRQTPPSLKKVLLRGGLLLGALLLAACNLPTGPAAQTPTPDLIATEVSQILTQMPTPTNTAAPVTSTPAPTAAPATEVVLPTPTVVTPTATVPPPSARGEPTWRNNMDSDSGLYLFENEGTRVTHEDGRMVLSGLIPNGWLGWSLIFSRQPRNFILEAVFIPQACSGADIYGMVFRAPNTNAGYFYGATCDGRYSLHARNFETDTDDVLIELASSNGVILTGAGVTNRLEVQARGDTIGLYANGTLLEEITDDTFESGYFGSFVAANETAGFTVWLDEISLWELP